MSKISKFYLLALLLPIFYGCSENSSEPLEEVIKDPCQDITCSDHGTCSVQNEIAICICEKTYRANGLSCICDFDLHQEGDHCVGNSKSVTCKEITVPDENGEQINTDVLINWNGSTWEEAANCDWRCKDGFTQNNNICELDHIDPCPDDMVPMGTICIDRYEASKLDATDSDMGIDDTQAMSAPNKIPWYVNPVTTDDITTFQNACDAAGKRLCRSDEWMQSCQTEKLNQYVFGNSFDATICNSVDTFCEDHCEVNSISSEECNLSANCGYQYLCFHVSPTGSFEGCTNSYGTFDTGGNVWEIVLSETDPRGYEVKGGAFNCAGAATRLKCSYNAGWSALYAGFRCCKDQEILKEKQ